MLNRLDSTTQIKRDGSLGLSANEPTKSTEKDIFRYSYNLGKQRRQIQRAASLAANIGGSFAHFSEEDPFSKTLLRRRTMPRSLSMESEIMLNYNKMRGGSVHNMIMESKRENDVLRRIPPLDVEAPMEASKETVKDDNEHEKANDSNSIATANENERKLEKNENENEKNENETQKTEAKIEEKDSITITTTRPKPISLSDSVPDLRFVANADKAMLQCEGFSSFKTTDSTEKAQSRPICKLRRAARRLGVSLSSEELYHKQRRNGMCTEIDDAADNRKLLRVLNKRF